MDYAMGASNQCGAHTLSVLGIRQLLQPVASPHGAKMWTGWPTFPMVFVNGVLVGGPKELAPIAC